MTIIIIINSNYNNDSNNNIIVIIINNNNNNIIIIIIITRKYSGSTALGLSPTLPPFRPPKPDGRCSAILNGMGGPA